MFATLRDALFLFHTVGVDAALGDDQVCGLQVPVSSAAAAKAGIGRRSRVIESWVRQWKIFMIVGERYKRTAVRSREPRLKVS